MTTDTKAPGQTSTALCAAILDAVQNDGSAQAAVDRRFADCKTQADYATTEEAVKTEVKAYFTVGRKAGKVSVTEEIRKSALAKLGTMLARVRAARGFEATSSRKGGRKAKEEKASEPVKVESIDGMTAADALNVLIPALIATLKRSDDRHASTRRVLDILRSEGLIDGKGLASPNPVKAAA